jgi:LytS/YehU family sensor histidine kinase
MSADRNPVADAVTGTALSALAGLFGGPWLAAVVGLACGLPVTMLAVAGSLALMIWLDPITGIWLAIAAIAAIGGFILGAVRKPAVTGLITCRDDSGQTIAHLQAQLALASQRERALLAALTHTHHDPGAPRALPAPVIRGQVTG